MISLPTSLLEFSKKGFFPQITHQDYGLYSLYFFQFIPMSLPLVNAFPYYLSLKNKETSNGEK